MLQHHLTMMWCCIIVLSAIALNNGAFAQFVSSSSSSSSGSWNPDPPNIDRVTGCIDNMSTTIECARPVMLTIHGTGLYTPTEDHQSISPDVQIDLPYRGLDYCTVEKYNATQIICKVPGDFNTMPTEQLLRLAVRNFNTMLTSPWFAGFSLKKVPLPTLTAVLGCSSNGRNDMTTNCDVMNDRITIVGSGFNSLTIDRYGLLFVGNEYEDAGFDRPNDLLLSFNDTHLVFSFAKQLTMLSLAAQRGVVQSVYITQRYNGWPGSWSTKKVFISFAMSSFPSPLITNVSPTYNDQGCHIQTNDDGTQQYRDCIAGVSTVTLSVKYLLPDSQFFVGGIKVNVQNGMNGYIDITMPIYRFDEGVFYNITVQTVGGTFTWPDCLEFNDQPIISHVQPCVLPTIGQNYFALYARCMPGERLYLSVLNVVNPVSPHVIIRDVTNTYITECTGAVMVDDTLLYCITPPMPNQLPADREMNINVYFSGGVKTHAIVVQQVWEPLDAPRITSVTGCYSNSNDPLHVNQCIGSMSSNATAVVLTLNGARLNQPVDGWTFWLDEVNVDVTFVSIDNETLVATLPLFNTMLVTDDIMYSITLSSKKLKSNAAYVTFVETENRDPVSFSSSNSDLVISLATVMSVLGVVFVVWAIVVFRRGRRAKHAANFLESESNSTALHHVELSQI